MPPINETPIAQLLDACAAQGRPPASAIDELFEGEYPDAFIDKRTARAQLNRAIDEITEQRREGNGGKARAVARETAVELATRLGEYEPAPGEAPDIADVIDPDTAHQASGDTAGAWHAWAVLRTRWTALHEFHLALRGAQVLPPTQGRTLYPVEHMFSDPNRAVDLLRAGKARAQARLFLDPDLDACGPGIYTSEQASENAARSAASNGPAAA